jgi:hypothetical protein
MESPSIEQLRHRLAIAQAENRADEAARLMRMIESHHQQPEPTVVSAQVQATQHAPTGKSAGKR